MTGKMHILHIANGDFFSTYGGGQVYVKNLVDEMINQEVDIVILSFKKSSNLSVEKKEYRGIVIYELYQNNSSIIKDLVRSIAPDIVHAHAEKALFGEICKELSIPYVITAHHGGITCPAGTLLNHKDEICHVRVNDKDCLPCVMRNTRYGLSFFYPWMRWFPLSFRLKMGRILQKLPFIYFVTPIGLSSLHIENKQKEWAKIVKNVDLMIAPSNAIAENMLLNGLKKETLKVIPHGIPFDLIAQKALPIDINNRIVKFFYVGRICYVKGIHVLLDAFSQLESTRCELHLVGDLNGKYQQELIRKYATHKNIIFHGKIDPKEVSAYIDNFDILVHPAIYLEVFGLNIAEALLEKKPVIATRCGGAEMQIEEGKNGLLVAPNNIESLKEAMIWMMSHPQEVAEMSKHAPDKVISEKKHVETLLENYRIVISNTELKRFSDSSKK